MEYYKFLKDKNQYKKGDVISTEKPNLFLKSLIAEKIVEKTSKPKK